MNKSVLAATAAATLLAGTALAQTTKPMNDPLKPAAQTSNEVTPAQNKALHEGKNASALQSSTAGITMAKTAATKVRFIEAKPADMMTSRLIGLDVYNNQNEKLGEIEDLAFEDGKTLTGVVVSVGGFLGMNERYVMIDPSTIVVNKEGNDDDDWKAFVDTTRDNLKNAPKFEYGEMKS